MDITFVTSNTKKAEFLSKYLNLPIKQEKLDLEEIQSLDLRRIAEHKVRQAYDIVRSPVLVEDISFTITALGKLPGPFIKWFIEELNFEGLCRLADLSEDRKVYTEVCYAYYDGDQIKFFEGRLDGQIPDHPRGDDGFGWNCVFIPEGQDKTNAEMSELETAKYSLRTTTVYPQLKVFIHSVQA